MSKSKNTIRKKIIPLASLIFCFLFLLSCNSNQPLTAKLWTDRPEFAFYAQLFNSTQGEFKIEVRHFSDLAVTLTTSKERPDIAIGSWLKSSKTISRFKPLDKILKNDPSIKKNLYSSLLNLGKYGRKQYLLPVSFDLPLIFFSQENNKLVNDQFVIDLETMEDLSKNYNVSEKGVFTQMGFSPLWNQDFLFETARIFGAAFHESETVEWNDEALDKSIVFLKDWINNINGGVQLDDDFYYKYFFSPPEELAVQGRILFAYMRSADFFIKTQTHSNLDFRILSGTKTEADSSSANVNKIIPVYEGAVYYGIDKKSKALDACDAFTLWFFKEATQELLLQQSMSLHIDDTVFGIANGYSAMKNVTENILPRFYPELLGHLPPEEYLVPAAVKPLHWAELKERVILPYMRDQCRSINGTMYTLEQDINEWLRHR